MARRSEHATPGGRHFQLEDTAKALEWAELAGHEDGKLAQRARRYHRDMAWPVRQAFMGWTGEPGSSSRAVGGRAKVLHRELTRSEFCFQKLKIS